MLFAQKGNRVQPVSDAEVPRFLNLGYNITDEHGNMIHEAMPDDIATLKSAFSRHVNTIKALQEENTKAHAEILELKAEIAKLSKSANKEAEPTAEPKQPAKRVTKKSALAE